MKKSKKIKHEKAMKNLQKASKNNKKASKINKNNN